MGWDYYTYRAQPLPFIRELKRYFQEIINAERPSPPPHNLKR